MNEKFENVAEQMGRDLLAQGELAWVEFIVCMGDSVSLNERDKDMFIAGHLRGATNGLLLYKKAHDSLDDKD